ncbi:uncharacterized protein LOC119738256 [Patiria miniata]|uniref:Shavenoid isoform B-like N-terminal domain-containing protein n=1 Tax=Patiria miniata TaxID=46514 RepID=A0A914AZN8_PATMI|nr:uncharacterized protein LOC119738256 [Patiria miniata]
MLVSSTLLPLTMILGLPLMSARSDQQQQQQEQQQGSPFDEASLSKCTGDKFWVNVTRRDDGDALTSACPRCGDLCRQARAVRLRCDLREYPCTCRCPENQTFRTDINLCVDSFSDCRSSSRIQLVDYLWTHFPTSPQPRASNDTNGSAPSACRVSRTQVLRCGGWVGLDSLNITEDAGLWKVALDTDGAGRYSLWWTGNLDAFQSLSGYILNLEISCHRENTETTSCAVVKMAGTRGYAVSVGGPSSPASVVVHGMTVGGEPTTEGAVPRWLVTSNSTAPTNYTKEMTDEEYKQLEMLVTAVCLSVALLLCVWLTCFALEKRVQSKKRGSEKQFASQTRTYTHEVSHCRKTLMDVYDMPMIRFNASMSGGGEEDETASLPVVPLKKKEKDSASAEKKRDREANGEESTSPSSSEQRMETGSSSNSSETLAGETAANQACYLGVPGKNANDPEFKNWRPCAKQPPNGASSKSLSSLSPTKRKNPPGILKKSPNTSPTRSPTRSPPMTRRSPTKKGILIKRSPILHKKWKNVVTRHFPHPQNASHNANQTHNAEGIEMKVVNGLSSAPEPHSVPKRSILKHSSRWKALAPKLAPMVRAEETEDNVTRRDTEEAKHHVVIKCEIHHEDERRETDVDSDEKAYTEKSPLTKSIKMVLDSRLDGTPNKKNCIEWRCEDYDGVPCTDV